MPCVTINVVGVAKFEWKNFRVELDGKVIDPATTPIQPGKQIAVLGELHNIGTAEGTVIIYLTVNGRRLKQSTATIKPGQHVNAGWYITIQDVGKHQVCLEYEKA
jgi:hypothetical protein